MPESKVPYDESLLRRLTGVANELRMLTLRAITTASSGHPGGSLSAAEILSVLYFHKMRIDPKNPIWEGRDRFILSKGHAAPMLYAALAKRGYFDEAELLTLRAVSSRLQGHPDINKTPGIDMSSGSLGQGLSVGLGMTLGNRLVDPAIHVYVLMGDGELQEGQVWEAAMAAGHFKPQHLVAIIDRNHVQLDGFVKDIMDVDPLLDKWRAFGWQTLEMDGHDVGSIMQAFDEAERLANSGPVVILAHTVKGKGVSYMEHQADWHGAAPSREQLESALDELRRRF